MDIVDIAIDIADIEGVMGCLSIYSPIYCYWNNS